MALRLVLGLRSLHENEPQHRRQGARQALPVHRQLRAQRDMRVDKLNKPPQAQHTLVQLDDMP